MTDGETEPRAAAGDSRPGPTAPDQTARPAGAGSAPPTAPHHRHLERDRLTKLLLTLGKVLGVVVTLVTLIGGVVTLLFQVDPGLEPCVGQAGVTFSDVSVIPGYPENQYFADITGGQVVAGAETTPGVEVRYNYVASNLSGHGLRPYLTLQQVASNGDLLSPPGPPLEVLLNENLHQQFSVSGQPANPVTPNRCSQGASGFDWLGLPPPGRPPRRYRLVLEFYRGKLGDFTQRVGVTTTPTFDY